MTATRTFPLALSLALLGACTLKIDNLTYAEESVSGDEPDSTSGDPSVPSTSETVDPPDTTGPDDTTTATATATDTDTPDTEGEPTPGARDVDILFVIDNSGSMASVQESLAAGIGPMVKALDQANVDYRIGITTTDSGNPRCPTAQYTPEVGAMVASSCRARMEVGEFTFADIDFSEACELHCGHAEVVIAPTHNDSDGLVKPRPWIEKIDGQANVDVPIAEAAACLLPQGVAGCGFEQPLESMHNALGRMSAADKPEFGFMRAHANLLVVLVTDETDCSFNPNFDEIFTTNKVFWNDPIFDPAPTSAICWRAGMHCVGGPGVYDSCTPAAIGDDAELAATEDEGVLHPLSRYRDRLTEIRDAKAALGPSRVYIAAIAGVPTGYMLGDVLTYADAADSAQQTDFGIGPGCESGEGDTLKRATPPGRIEALVVDTPDALPLGQGLYSICDPLSGLPEIFGELLLQ